MGPIPPPNGPGPNPLLQKIQTTGYIRVSTLDQNTARQLDGCQLDKVFVDKISGKNTTRPALTRPSTTQDGSVILKGRITGVRGLVEVKNSETAKWAAAKEGMIVDEGAEFRTGPRRPYMRARCGHDAYSSAAARC